MDRRGMEWMRVDNKIGFGFHFTCEQVMQGLKPEGRAEAASRQDAQGGRMRGEGERTC
jgi:hypothetical protein